MDSSLPRAKSESEYSDPVRSEPVASARANRLWLACQAARLRSISAWRRPIRLVATLFLCASLSGVVAAAPGEPAAKKGGRAPTGQVRSGKKKSRRPSKKPAASQPEQSEDTAASQPSEQDGSRETIATALGRLSRIRRGRADRDTALKTGLEFVRAWGRADGQKAAALLEVTGYQTMPTGEDLPEEPGRRIAPDAFGTEIAGRKPAAFDTLPVDCVEVVSGKSLRPRFPVVAAWMLPTDWAVILKPVPERQDWVQRQTCLVIRIRAGKPTIQGGTPLDAAFIPLPPEAPEPTP